MATTTMSAAISCFFGTCLTTNSPASYSGKSHVLILILLEAFAVILFCFFQLFFFLSDNAKLKWFSVLMNQDEWVISRVFQQRLSSTGNGGSAVSSASGSKKTNIRMSCSITMSLYPEPSSPSIYLPPLLDSSPYAAAANDRDGCSYNGTSTTPREHVSCFSTFSASAAANNLPNVSYELAPPPPRSVVLDPFARFQNKVGVPSFPSLRSLQDNLQLPFVAQAAID